MVDRIANLDLDPVAKRLASAGEDQSAGVLQWLEAEQQRRTMRRRATLLRRQRMVADDDGGDRQQLCSSEHFA